MEMGMTPELLYGQNVFVSTTAAPYHYGYAEVASPMEWYNQPSSLGYDSQDIYYPVTAEGVQCVYYAAPDNGSLHTSYSPYPVDASVMSDGSFVTPEYVAGNTNSTCQMVPPSYPPPFYIPSSIPYTQDSVPGSTTALHTQNVAYLPTMPAYAATSVNGALPLIAPVNTISDMVVNPPIQSTIVSSKQFEDHTNLNFQLHNSVPQMQERPDGSMVPVKLPNASQASVHLLEVPKSTPKHSSKEKLSANNCIGCAGADLSKWASAEKFHPSSKLSSNLKGSGQKLSENGLGDSEKPNNQKSSAIIVKSYTSRLTVSNPEGMIHIRPDEFNRHDLRVDYTYAKFFVIKSIGEADVHKSIKYGVWSSSSSGNIKLDNAFRDADRISKRNNTKCPVFLFFSVNGSGHFCGMAEMVGPVDFRRDMDFWSQDKWSGCFPVRWHIVKDIPNYSLQHITLQNNENKPVTHSRDTQEIPYIPGITLLKIFKDIKVKECLFDDFMRYEVEEARVKQYRRRKLSHNAPDFVPVSHRREDASDDAQQLSHSREDASDDAQQMNVSSVLIDKTLEVQNVSEKPHQQNLIKHHQDPCVESVKKRASDAEKENGQELPCNKGMQSQQDTTNTNQTPASSLRTVVDGKQQYWKKVENPRMSGDNTAQGLSKAPEKHLNGGRSPSAVVSETSEEQEIIGQVASLKITSKAGDSDRKSCPVGVVTIGSMPVWVSEL